MNSERKYLEVREEIALRLDLQREMTSRRPNAPGMLKVWSTSAIEQKGQMKEVIAIIRPWKWTQTKVRVQRLRLGSFTQHRVLGRGLERGLKYLPRKGAVPETGVRYLPKRMISWVVPASQVELLVQTIIQANQTGQLGDGKIFVLPVDGAVRIRTGEYGVEVLQPHHSEVVWGTVEQPSNDTIIEKVDHASGQ